MSEIVEIPEFPVCPTHGRTYRSGCQPCRDRHAAIRRYNTRQKAYGRPLYAELLRVNHDEVRVHLIRLRDSVGLSSTRIAELAQTDGGYIRKLWSDNRRPLTLHKDLADRILAIPLDGSATPRFVSRVGSTRRLLALTFNRWSVQDSLRILHNDEGSLRVYPYHMGHPTIRATFAEEIKNLYERNSNRYGPSEKAAKIAIRKMSGRQIPGQEVAPPLAWDGVDMDDIDARPIGVRQFNQRRTTKQCPPRKKVA